MNAGVPQRNYTVVEIPKELHQRLKPYAVNAGQSVKSVIVQAVTEFMERIKDQQNNVTQATN